MAFLPLVLRLAPDDLGVNDVLFASLVTGSGARSTFSTCSTGGMMTRKFRPALALPPGGAHRASA